MERGWRRTSRRSEYLRDGEAVGIFPEATISRAFVLKEFKTGAVRIAAAAGVPLVPVILWGTHRMITKDHPKDFSRGKTIAINVGVPLHPTGEDPVGRDRRAAQGDVGDARRDHPDLSPRRAAPRVLVVAGRVRRVRADASRRRPGWTPRRRRERAKRRAAKR